MDTERARWIANQALTNRLTKEHLRAVTYLLIKKVLYSGISCFDLEVRIARDDARYTMANLVYQLEDWS